jgi:DNA-binding CsgD family transcriptional regulator
LLLTSIGNSWLAEVDRLSGRLHESEAEATTAWDIASISEGFSTFGWSAWMNLAATLLARGNVEGLRQLIGDFDLSEGPGQVPLNPWPIEVRAHLRLAEGDLEAAAQDFSELGEGLEEVLGWLNPSYPAWRQEAAEALAALGRTAEANHLLSVAEERAHIFGAPHAIASVLRAKATIEPRGRAIRTLRESIELYEESGPPHELGRSLMALGTVLRNAGDRSEARTILGRALEVAAGCGAEGLERKVRDELAAAGSRPRRAALTGVGALTASELKTAKLAAAGLTNSEIAERLFVTVRTVETHLTHAYDKLMIPGRRKLVEALADHSS